MTNAGWSRGEIERNESSGGLFGLGDSLSIIRCGVLGRFVFDGPVMFDARGQGTRAGVRDVREATKPPLNCFVAVNQ